jgi:hypothetical protein
MIRLLTCKSLLLGLLLSVWAFADSESRCEKSSKLLRSGSLTFVPRVVAFPSEDFPAESGSFDRYSPVPLSKKLLEEKAVELLQEEGYRQVKLLGSGGMGTVLSGVNRQGQRKILKLLHRHDKVHREGFEHEAAVMNYLHPLDPRFLAARRLEFSLPNGDAVMAFETDFIRLRPGSPDPALPLDKLLQDPTFLLGKPELREAIREQYTSLLFKAHRAGISHLDLKPHNLVVSWDENEKPVVHLIDWGMSHDESGVLSSPYLKRSGVNGTLGYMPEARLLGKRKPQPSDDVFASRIIDWRTRAALHSREDTYVVRNIKPSPLSPAREEPPVKPVVEDDISSTDVQAFVEVEPESSVPRDSSGFRSTYKEPAFAQDQVGSPLERLVAMAEWSAWPQTILDRERLILSAKRLPKESFLEAHGDRLESMPEPERKSGYRHALAKEVLGSTVLIENLGVGSGLKLSQPALEAIARTAALYYRLSFPFRKAPRALGIFGPHSDYHYDQLGKKIDELAAQGILRPWSDWLREESGLQP